MSLPTLESVQKLQTALHAKAKGEPKFRFYALYDKVYRKDVLWSALRRCRHNGGVPGVDGQTFEDIELYGETKWLEELAEELRKQTYQPRPVRRAYIRKSDGKQRPLGIPTIKDRVVQTAVRIVLEPIFEADLQPDQYAYRATRSALDAVRAVHRLLNAGYTEVVDADLSGYFDSIPHAELMACVARRVSDKAVLHLLKMWLVAPAEETDARGHAHRTTRNKDEGRGSPQGAPMTPPTKVQNSLLASCGDKRGEADAIGDADLVWLDSDTSHERPNDLASGGPIGLVEAVSDMRGEFVEAAQRLSQVFALGVLSSDAFEFAA